MIDVSEVINDPDLAQEYTVLRSTGGKFSAGGWQEGTPTEVPMYGPILVASEKELLQLPEGDRVTSALVFYSTEPFVFAHAKDPKGTSDKAVYKGEQYKLYRGADRGDYGYHRAIGVRMEGA